MLRWFIDLPLRLLADATMQISILSFIQEHLNCICSMAIASSCVLMYATVYKIVANTYVWMRNNVIGLN